MDLLATALPALGEAFALILQPQQLMYLMLGVLLGLLLGAVIGLWPFQQVVPPEPGTMLKGERVVEVDGALMLESSGRAVEAEDYETQTFTPTAGQAAGSIGLIALGFAVSAGIAHIGGRSKE